MVRMARFSSDDPGWVDPDDRFADRRLDDEADCDDPRVRQPRAFRRRSRPNLPRVPDPRGVQATAVHPRAKPRPRRRG